MSKVLTVIEHGRSKIDFVLNSDFSVVDKLNNIIGISEIIDRYGQNYIKLEKLQDLIQIEKELIEILNIISEKYTEIFINIEPVENFKHWSDNDPYKVLAIHDIYLGSLLVRCRELIEKKQSK